ncbi:SDR family NAD(P)-dependent oxidoreductase [Thalassobaculum sp.]|uniref:SDR family NAD(P)-dependent oxidoreductase n=1 Tax=Thalassobaculum sp. TaxID=2022740 RepID=UPI0032EF11EB
MGLDGRHALVTGGSRGIGAAIAAALAVAGARVTVLGRDRAALDAVAGGTGGRAVVADVTDAAALDVAIAEAEAGFGPIDILVNNAGSAETAKFAAADDALWERMIALNLTSVVRATRRVLPGMLARDWGRIVTVASTAGLKGYAYASAYSAAKHAVVGLTRSLALETARTDVTVNAVCPGYTDTDLVRGSVARLAERTGRPAEALVAEMVAGNPQRRLIEPEEVARTVVWLADPASGSMTGQAIAVAGGEIM